MKINLLNKIYLTTAVLLLVASIVNILRFKRWETYYYFSSVSIPAPFPVYIREAYFSLPNDEYASISTEDSERFITEWGKEYYFPETNENQRLPEKLVLKYVSYQDSKFYADTIQIPQKDMKSIFKDAAQHGKFDEIYSNGGNRKGLRFVIGIANKGNIIIWLRGKDFEQEILKTRIMSHMPKGDDTYYVKRLSTQAYLDHAFENLSDSAKQQIDKGWEADANYIDTPSKYIDRISKTN